MASKEITRGLPGPASQTSRLPLLVDLFLNISLIFVLLVAIITAVASVLARVDVVTVVFRTGIAILCVGIPVYVLNFLFGRYYVQATYAELEASLPKPEVSVDETEHGELETIA